MMAKICPHYPNIYWRNVVHELGLICTYPPSVQKALEKIFHQNLARESKVALIWLIPAGSEGSASKYLLQLLLTAAIKCIMIRWSKHDAPTYHMLLDMVWEIS